MLYMIQFVHGGGAGVQMDRNLGERCGRATALKLSSSLKVR